MYSLVYLLKWGLCLLDKQACQGSRSLFFLLWRSWTWLASPTMPTNLPGFSLVPVGMESSACVEREGVWQKSKEKKKEGREEKRGRNLFRRPVLGSWQFAHGELEVEGKEREEVERNNFKEWRASIYCRCHQGNFLLDKCLHLWTPVSGTGPTLKALVVSCTSSQVLAQY